VLSESERLILEEADRIRGGLVLEGSVGERVLDHVVDYRKAVEALGDMEGGNEELLRTLYVELRKSLGSFTSDQMEAIRRFNWVIENYRVADEGLIRNNLGKGINAIAPGKTPKFF
jgi:hypothetical protein